VLTRESIIAMEPGRKMDAEVALRVMGVKEVTVVGHHYYIEPLDKKLPAYSTDISAAWELINKAQSDGRAWGMSMVNVSQEVDVQIGRGIATSNSVPEAICKAALLTTLEYDRD